MIPLELQTHPDRGSVSFVVRVQPRASKNEVSGVMDGALKIRLQAPAVREPSERGPVRISGGTFERPKSAVRLLSGERGRSKRVEIFGVSTQEIEALALHEV